MEKSKTFLSWWLFTFFSLASVIFINQIGFFQDLNQNDQTKISFVVLILYIVMSIVCGKNAKKLDQTYLIKKEEEFRFRSMGIVTKWFAVAFTTMGMIGTVIGFISAFLPLLDLDTNNAEMVQEMASDLAGGIMTAMYTTLVGMVCGLFLAFQNLIVDRSAKKKLAYYEESRGTDSNEIEAKPPVAEKGLGPELIKNLVAEKDHIEKRHTLPLNNKSAQGKKLKKKKEKKDKKNKKKKNGK